jgi:NADPH:quinone reductase-like Zn-dependent oxidoreductase
MYSKLINLEGNMKAAQITSYDGPSSVVINEVDVPSIAADQVLVEVKAAAVNPFDWKVTEGMAKDWVALEFPATIGGDVAGVVSQVGADVTNVTVGQEVYGSANALSGNGSFAEYAPVKAANLASKPKSVDFAAAAAYPLVAASAYQAVVATANVQVDQKVLIHGGAGGIGSQAIQIAKAAGAYVATTASSDDVDYVKALGADEVIDYKNQDFSTLLKDYDLVFDTVGGETNTKSYQILKAGGLLISMAAQPDDALVEQYNVRASYQSTTATTEYLTSISALIDGGKLTVNIDKTFTLDQAAEALTYQKAGHVRGKVVILV